MNDFNFVLERPSGAFEEIPYGQSFTVGGTLHPWQVAECWTDEELSELGGFRAVPLVIPEGMRFIRREYVRDAQGHLSASDIFEDLPVLPITVAASSAKLVLDDDGLYAAVEAVCLAHPVNAVRIFWNSANTWSEANPYVQAIGIELGLTEAQMHEKFVRAFEQYELAGV